MNKTEFLDALRHALGKLPSYEVEQSIAFYAEMIDDRIEDGMSEQEAVAQHQARPNTPMVPHRSSVSTTAHSATTTDQMAR